MIVAVTGKTAGKSTLISNLACASAKAQRLTGCFSTDLSYQSLNHFFGVKIISDGKSTSIGNMFNEDKPAKFFSECPLYNSLYVASTLADEDCFKHEPPDFDIIDLFLSRLTDTFDVLYVECNTLRLNGFSAFAIAHADIVINVTAADPEGVMYDNAFYTPFLSRLVIDKPIINVCVLNRFVSVSEISDKYSHPIDYFLPYSEDVAATKVSGLPVYANGSLGFKLRKYIKAIDGINKIILDGGVV